MSGTVTINGATITSVTTQGEGTIYLRNQRGTARLGSTSNIGGGYSSLVFPGTYDLYLRGSAGGTTVPSNTAAKLQSGIVVGATPLKLDIDLESTKVSGTITVNGSAIKDISQTDQGTVSLVNATGDSVVLIFAPPTGTYSQMVIPGTYDVYFNNTSPGVLLPTNSSVKLQSGVVVGSAPLTLNVDIPAPKVSATVTINGAAIPAGAKGKAGLVLVDASGASAPLPTYTASTDVYSGRVVPGTYDLYWSAPLSTEIPDNTHAKLKSGIVVGTSALSITANLPSSTLSGKVTVGGAAPDQPIELAYLALVGDAGDSAPIVVSADGSYSTRVVPGTYGLYYDSQTVGLPSFPRNSYVSLREGIVIGTSPASLDVDIPSTVVSGKATLNGAGIATAAQSAFVLTLQSTRGDRAQLANNPTGGAFSVSVLPGTYDLYYTRQGNPGFDVPNNTETKIRSGIVVGTGAPVSLDVDIRGTLISGAITVNGALPVATPGELAFVTLGGAQDDQASLGSVISTTGTYSAFVIPGTYDLSYLLYLSGGKSLPSNTHARFGCFVVP